MTTHQKIESNRTFLSVDSVHGIRREVLRTADKFNMLVLSEEQWNRVYDIFYDYFRKHNHDMRLLTENHGVLKFMDLKIVYASWLTADEIEVHFSSKLIYQQPILCPKNTN